MAKPAKRHLKAVPDQTEVVPTNDELEALLSEDTDEEFGYPDLQTDPKPVKLKDWKAEDFASIYVRFRPHLERHARKFLNNQSQIDEVVQDAFLYLMVSLPELDSEIGVLKFMKWKVKNLCIDIYRAQGKAYVNSIDDIAEPQSNEKEHDEVLEQAEDAAIVRLALSKLNPRHREVLVAQIYEEKTIEEIAMQINLSENATRQLTFRARAAFKKALLGDVDTDGMSMAKILSVAARKAAEEAKKAGVQAMVLVLFLALSIGAFFSQNSNSTSSTPVAEAPANNYPSTPETNSNKPVSAQPVSNPRPTKEVPLAADVFTVNSISQQTAKTIAASNSDTDIFIFKDLRAGTFTLEAAAGITATFEYDPALPAPVKNLTFKILADGIEYKAFALSPQIDLVNGQTQISGQLSDLIDLNGMVYSNNALSKAYFTLNFALNGNTATGHLSIK
jgi:RNA polymerase sigma-70 factor (ECF subfamily)